MADILEEIVAHKRIEMEQRKRFISPRQMVTLTDRKIKADKVIQEAALRSGISRGSINAAWDAIGEVIKAWATEGHSVAVPGLGSGAPSFQ